jgi:hypothetical protein
VAFPNTFVIDNPSPLDLTPPTWTSTYNANINPFPTPPDPPDARVGIQEVITGLGLVILRWDVALDQSRVNYVLYQDTTPFDFVADPALVNSVRVELDPTSGAGYEKGVGPGVFAYEAMVSGLSPGTTYHFVVRAADALGNEEENQVVLTATPHGPITMDGDFTDWTDVAVAVADPAEVIDSAGPDWLEVKVANDATHLGIRFTSENAFNLDGSPTYGFSRTLIFIDADDDPSTGYATAGGTVGSELLIFGDSLYQQATGVFNDGFLETLTAIPTTAVTECELAVPLVRIEAAHPGARRVRIALLNDEVFDAAPDAGFIAHTITQP